MSTNEDHIVRERRPVETLIPALNGSLELSEKQIKFLIHTIRDVNPEANDAEVEIRRRVLEVQSKAYKTYPYPCIRGFHYVKVPDKPMPLCSSTLAVAWVRICVTSSRLGIPLRPSSATTTHARSPSSMGTSLASRFVRSLNELRGRVKYVYAGSLFHLFDEGTQEAIARRLAVLLHVSEGNGPAVLFGRYVAQQEEGVIDDAMGRTRYAHSPASWGKLWEWVLGRNIRVRVDSGFPRFEKLRELKGGLWNPGRGTQMMWWSVWVG
ncbi:hypothetical protein OG21DRAFT_665169 [Imleria badia]|nr:hypothetical protein OG21DRAFT_665169 [Imleria badia]